MRRTTHIFSPILKIVLLLGLLSTLIFETSAQDPPKKYTTRITFESTQKNNGEIGLRGILKARIGRSYTNVSGQPLTFFIVVDGEERIIREIVTDMKGEAHVLIPSENILADTSGKMDYLVRYEGNDTLRSRESEMTIFQTKLNVEGVEEDSTYFVDIKVNQIKGNTEVPAQGVDVNLYVPRLFSNLKVGEGTTDDFGNLRIEFPQDIRGNQEGLIKILAKVEENEQFGSLEAEMEQNWGIPLVTVAQQNRTLWSPDPPIWMVITFILMIGAVWGHYAIIVHKLILIKKRKNQVPEI